ncbi:ester cyclase [Amycolatopsis methanolica]|uniref:ester cyclase n=1 Tax=Amycolatopsis methanolica TaxID=1814 RepID=UPI003F4DA51B
MTHAAKPAIAPQTRAERNTATMRRIYEEVFDQGRVEVLEELFAPDLVNHTPPEPHRHGIEPVRGLVAMLRAAFPDCRTVIEDMVADCDVVVMRNWFEGTHLGPFLGHEAETERPAVPFPADALDAFRIGRTCHRTLGRARRRDPPSAARDHHLSPNPEVPAPVGPQGR